MLNTLIKRCCVAILAGPALSVSMDAKKATAQYNIDEIINVCAQRLQTGELNLQEIEYCQEVIKLRLQQEIGEYQRQQFENTLNQIYQIMNAPPLEPTDFGFGKPSSN